MIVHILHFKLTAIMFSFHSAECPDNTFECPNGRINGLQPPCIPTVKRCDNVTDCTGGEDEYCGCGPDGSVRLVDGNGPHEGRVELCSGGKWTTVCHHGWDNNEAAVVCRQLGFPSQSMSHCNCTCVAILFDVIVPIL